MTVVNKLVDDSHQQAIQKRGFFKKTSETAGTYKKTNIVDYNNYL